jgi:hypothetical protein
MNYKRCLIYCLVFNLISCKNDDKSFRKTIIGTWDVYASEMNDKPNGFMKDGYFVFSADSSVTSNIFSGNQTNHYIVEKNRLLIDTEDKFDMKISKLEGDTMRLEGNMSFYFMKYFLVRRK